MEPVYAIQDFMQIAITIVVVATQIVHTVQGHFNLIAFFVKVLIRMRMDLNVNVKRDTMRRLLRL